jgi:hypothetical protein
MIIKSNFLPVELYYKFIEIKFKDKPISIFNDYIPSYEELLINPYNILVIMEPNQLFGLHDRAIENKNNFSCIFTWSSKILDNCDNAILFPFGTTFLHGKDRYKELANKEKILNTSYLCGVKNITEGHYLRQKIYSKKNEIITPKKWFYTVDGSKDICFENSMFHIAVENSKNKNYFTEKIIDSLITKTVPLYWGCPNIEDFFDSRGIICFENENELIQIINSLTEKDYIDKQKYIEYNYNQAIYYAEYFKRFEELLYEIIKLNNI